MKLLDSSFDEKKLGYSSWQSFIKDAQNHSNVRFENGDNSKLKFEGSTSTKLPVVFVKLIKVLNTLKSDWDDDGYISVPMNLLYLRVLINLSFSINNCNFLIYLILR